MMEQKCRLTSLTNPFVLSLRSQNCFCEGVPAEETKTVKALAAKPRRRLVWILPLAVLAVAAGWLSQRGTEAAAGGNQNKRIKSTFHLETFVLNLADPGQRSYLRVGIDLGLNKEAGRGETSAAVAQVRDTILSVLGLAKVEDLLTAQGKIRLKEDLLKALQQRMPELGVEEIYFTEFLIQR
jgi:flagellar FliL protein